MSLLDVRNGYRLWAPTYARETAVSDLEDRIVTALSPAPAGLRLLDAGCGIGRRLHESKAALAVGVDLSPEMLDAGQESRNDAVRTLVGDVRALPLPDRSFDLVWCRLVLGHLPDCAPAYAELARVADSGATVIVTDFHPAAHEAGHRRTFRADGVVHELEHHVHTLERHQAAAAAAGLELVEVREGKIGSEIRDHFVRADRIELYTRQVGLPIVLALAFRRPD